MWGNGEYKNSMSVKGQNPPRIRRTSDDSRENILSAAEALLVEQGPQALRLAEVAKRAGVANATVLHHFKTVSGVQSALMERMITALVSQIISVEMTGDLSSARAQMFEALYNAFEAKSTARLAAWLELTDEAARFATVHEAINTVLIEKQTLGDFTVEQIEDVVLASICMALGVGLFGNTAERAMNRRDGLARELALQFLLVGAGRHLGTRP